MRRRTFGTLLIMIMLAVTGCVQLPRTITETQPISEPAWTDRQALTVRSQISQAYGDAVLANTPKQALDLLDGIERSTAAGQFALHSRFDIPVDTDSWRTGTVVASWSTPKTSYPQTGFVVTRLKKKVGRAGQLLEVYSRAGSAASWKRSASVRIVNPITWPSTGSLTRPAAARVNGLDTARVPQFVDAMNAPTARSDARFVKNDAFLESRRNLSAVRKAEGTSTASDRYSVVGDTWSFASGSTTWLVVPCHLTSVTTLKSNWIFKIDKRDRKEYPGEYDGSSSTYTYTYLIRVPRTGKIEIMASQATQIDFSYF